MLDNRREQQQEWSRQRDQGNRVREESQKNVVSGTNNDSRGTNKKSRLVSGRHQPTDFNTNRDGGLDCKKPNVEIYRPPGMIYTLVVSSRWNSNEIKAKLLIRFVGDGLPGQERVE